MPIKILVISNYMAFHTVRPEAEMFIGLAKKGYEIHIMTEANSIYAQIFKENGIKLIDFLPKKKGDKKEIAFIREYLKKEKFDVMQLFNNRAILAGIPASKGIDVKIVLYRGYEGNVAWWDPISYTKFLHPRVDKIVCNSKGVEEYFHKQLFFKKGKTITINKGHRTEWYSNVEKYPIRKELGIKEDSFLMVNTANDRRMKGIKYLLTAMQNIPKNINAHLLIIGEGMDKPKYKKIIDACPQPNRIHLLGFRKDVLNITASCDVFVLSSIKGESITKSVIEAMSLSVAPLITDIPGNKELVVHEESGIVVPSKNPKALADAMLRLYNNRDFVKKLEENAFHRIQSFLTTERTIEEYDVFYRDLTKKELA